MKAVVIKQAGGPEQLVYQDVPNPQIKDGWSLVKIKGFGINHSEIFTRKGLSPSVHFPRILGIECVGIIDQTTDPHRLPVGQRVISIMGEMGRAFDGSYAEYTLLPNSQIYPVDTQLDWATLATIPETYYTAFGSLLNLKLKPTDKVLVRGGASGVGVAFTKLAHGQNPDLDITATTRHLNKINQLTAVGYNHVIEDRDGQLQSGQRFDKILELVGPATTKDSFQHTVEGGIICSTGQLGNQWYLPKFDPIEDIAPNAYLTSFASANVDGAKLNRLLDFIEHYHIEVKPEKIFKLKDVPKAHEYLESSHGFGKVIVLN